MTDNDKSYSSFGLNVLDPDSLPSHRQNMADLLALLGLHEKFHLILTSDEHDSLLRAIARLSELLAISFETFGLHYRNGK